VDFFEIEKKAQQVLEKFGYKGDGAVEIVELAESEGFIVGETSFEDKSDGMIFVNMKTKEILGHQTQKLILVNKELESYFKRFVIAHELGHYFLETNNQSKNFILAHRDASVKENDECERDMDYFAACLLMPAASFKYIRDVAKILLKESDPTPAVVSLLTDFFKVPERSVERRLNEVIG